MSMLTKLRTKITDHMSQHMYESAVFWADKLVTMSGNDAEDVYRLAQAYYLAGLHQRSMHAIRQAGLTHQHDKFRYLVAKCHVVREEWEQALEALGEDLMVAEDRSDGETDFRPAMCLLRGKVYDAMDNRPKSIESYRRALQLDCYCYEAFEHLTQHHLLSSSEQEALMQEVNFGAGDEWVALMCRTKIDRYQTQSTVEMAMDKAAGQQAAASTKVPAAASPIVHLEALHSQYGLDGNLDLQASRAETQYYGHDYSGSISICREILKKDPHNLT